MKDIILVFQKRFFFKKFTLKLKRCKTKSFKSNFGDIEFFVLKYYPVYYNIECSFRTQEQ